MLCTKVDAAAWLNGKGRWSAYYNGEHSVLPTKVLKNSHAHQYKIHNEIILAIKFLQLKKEYYKRLDLPSQVKTNRIEVIDQQLNFLQKEKNKYIPYIHRDSKSLVVEYGLQDNLNIGVKSLACNGWNKTTNEYYNEELGGFIKAQLWQKGKKIISVQPYISISKSNSYPKNVLITELKLFSSQSNDLQTHHLKKYKIEKFTNYEFAFRTLNYKPYTIFSSEISHGLKFCDKYYIIWQNIYNSSKQLPKLYKQTLKEQISVAKTISCKSKNLYSDKSSFTLQIGYFNEISITYKQPLSSGVFLSLWMQT